MVEPAINTCIPVALLAFIGCGDKRATPEREIPPVAPAPAAPEDARAAPDPTVEVWLGGDVHLGAVDADVLAPLGEVLAGAVGVINLEGPVGRDAAASTAERLVNDAGGLPVLARYGVAVAGLANNHAADLGPAGARRTEDAVRAAGLAPAAGATVAVVERAGLRLAVTAHDLSRGVPADLAENLAQARAGADHLIATFHVLAPPLYLPRPELEEAVAIALAAGARVVVSHGSHAPARVERRGDAIIAWGLGNLLFACECTEETDGLIVRVALSRARIESAAVIPVDAGLHGQPARPAEDAALMFDLLESLRSSPLGRAGDRAFF